MLKHGIRCAASGVAALLLTLMVGCSPAARSESSVRMTAPPRTTAAERPVRTADPIRVAPRQEESPVVAPEVPSKPADADSVEDRHPSRWPKKLRAKFAMIVD